MKHSNTGAILLIMMSAILSCSANAQGTYRSKDGTISVTTTYFGRTITAHSKQVRVTLDYNTAEFVFSLALADLHTGIDSLDRKLRAQTNSLSLSGNLNLGEINTTQHPPQDFVFTGRLLTGKSKHVIVKGSGRLEHIDGGEDMACELAAYFDTTTEALGLFTSLNTAESQPVAEVVKVQFYKTLLKRYY